MHRLEISVGGVVSWRELEPAEGDPDGIAALGHRVYADVERSRSAAPWVLYLSSVAAHAGRDPELADALWLAWLSAKSPKLRGELRTLAARTKRSIEDGTCDVPEPIEDIVPTHWHPATKVELGEAVLEAVQHHEGGSAFDIASAVALILERSEFAAMLRGDWHDAAVIASLKLEKRIERRRAGRNGTVSFDAKDLARWSLQAFGVDGLTSKNLVRISDG